MLYLSFNFKQNLMDLFLAACECILVFLYLCLGTKHYMHSQKKVELLHYIVIYLKEH